MSPTPPEWPVPSTVALGMWDDEEGEFHATSVFPVTFEQIESNYNVSLQIPSDTTATAMALAFPESMPVEYAADDANFEGAFNGNTYVAWRALTPMSQISGHVNVNLVGGGVVQLYYDFT